MMNNFFIKNDFFKDISFKKKMKFITLFSGIGMQEEGMKKVCPDIELINFCEYDKNIAKCFELVHNEPSSKNLGDITKLNMKEYSEKIKDEKNS